MRPWWKLSAGSPRNQPVSGSISSLRRSASRRASRSRDLARQQLRDRGRARTAARPPPRAPAPPAPRDAGVRCGQRAAHGWSAASRGSRGRRAGRPAIALAFERAVLHQHAHQLADEERVALADREHASRDRGRQLVGADRIGGEARRRPGVETGERHHVGHDAAGDVERRARVAQLGARRHQQQQRHVGAPLHQVLDEIEEQRLGPLQVVDHEHDRLRARRARRGSAAPRRRSPPARAGVPASSAATPSAMRARSASSPGMRARSPRARCRRSAPSSSRKSARSASASGANVAPPVASQCALTTVAASPSRRTSSPTRRDLPRPGEPSTTASRAARRRDRRVVHRREARSSSSRPTNAAPARPPAARATPRDRPPPSRPALERERAERLERHEVAHQPPRRLADQHVAVLRLLLQARRDVHRIADDVVVLAAHHHLAGVDGDAQPDLAEHSGLLLGELAERLLHRDRGAHGADRVVLGHARHAESRHHAVAEQLHDRAAVRRRRPRAAPRSSGP